MWISRSFIVAAVAVGIALPAVAADPPLRLELNRLESRDGGTCRVWLVLNNGGGEAVDPVRLDLVLFARNGVVSRRVAVDVGPLPAGRTQARIFDLAGQSCDEIGSVLLNDLLSCGSTEPAARNDCLDRLNLASRVDGVALQK